jgi:hypothetical protein
MEGQMSKRPFPFRNKLILAVVCTVGALLAGLAIAQAQAPSISLNSPASFPVDI